GKFPLWLAPEQLRVATLNNEAPVMKLAQEIVDQAKELGLRASLDDSNESVGKKIHDAEAMKVPYTVVVGGKEVESGRVAARGRAGLPEIAETTVDELLAKLVEDASARR